MVVLKPFVQIKLEHAKGCRSIVIDDENLIKTIEYVEVEKIPYKKAILLDLSKKHPILKACLVYYNFKLNKVEVTLLAPFLTCLVEKEGSK